MGVRKGSLEAGCRVNCSGQGAGPSSYKGPGLSLYWWRYRGLVLAMDEQGRAGHWEGAILTSSPQNQHQQKGTGALVKQPGFSGFFASL